MNHLFKITKNYFYTPSIIIANVAVWVIMVITGVGILDPSVESLINWGGNLSSITLSGEPWRLFTSIFLHGGIVHLLFNMYALMQVGAILETHFGTHRYAVVYLVTGIFASLASAAFSGNVVSVGASGAIFGLYGLLLSLLITKSLQIDAEDRKQLLSSTIFFIGYNVVFGFASPGIDNAAHLGGLFSGFIIGFLYYPFIRKQASASVLSIALIVIVAICAWEAPLIIKNPYAEYDSMIEKFSAIEEDALWMYEDIATAGGNDIESYRERLKTQGIDLWKKNLSLVNSVGSMPPELEQRVVLLRKYCELRIESCETLMRMTENQTDEDVHKLEETTNQIDDVINSLEELNKK